MRVEPVGLDDHQRRPAAAANVLERLRRRFVQSLEVPGVGLEDARAERLGAGADVTGDRQELRRRLAIAVVLANDQMREIPQVGDVCRFIQDAFAERAFADEGNDDRLLARELAIERDASRDRQKPALLAIGDEPLVAKVLAAAYSRANPIDIADQFVDQATPLAGCRNEMAVASMV